MLGRNTRKEDSASTTTVTDTTISFNSNSGVVGVTFDVNADKYPFVEISQFGSVMRQPLYAFEVAELRDFLNEHVKETKTFEVV